jgi:two-component system CheB/CheR fusion protein
MSESHNEDISNEPFSDLFPVVGVGASAGGLEAFKRMIRAIPEKTGIVFILVQHMEPTHDSLLTDLLQKLTQIPIREIRDNITIEPDHIYIIPSNKQLTAGDGRLQLSPRPPKTERFMSIDLFFTSLAEVYQSRAIGVILSGTGTDGTAGLNEIKDHGGITFSQDPQSAAYSGMPQSAIDAEAVDFILPPEEIPAQLVRLTKTFNKGLTAKGQDLQQAKEDAFKELLHLLRVRKDTDFTYYKQTTIRRRIIRRMGLNKLENIGDYVTYFKEHIPEQDLLYQDLLIPVTGFFRDPKTYETLSETIFPLLLKSREQSRPLRIWVAGCATGEEAYSIAMSLHEFLGAKAPESKIQIFASDISEKSIAKARSGIYAKRDMANLQAERVEKYFVKTNGSFQVNKFIRDMCVFACHNFLKDPPFAKMDFISCRNVLIYMESYLQKRALSTFHYALNENGYLLLGNSETIAPAADLFSAFRKTEKLFIRKSGPARLLHVAAERNERTSNDKINISKKITPPDDFQKSADETVLAKYTPPGVVVNEMMEIVQFRGSTGTWLEPSSGKPSLNILKMAKEGLAFELRNALHKAKTNNQTEIRQRIPFMAAGQQQWVNLEVTPLANTVELYFLILFRETFFPADPTSGAITEAHGNNAAEQKSAESEYIRQLEKELAQLREDMRSITEDQEAINEELQSTNEELLSGSEELQSLNEELETSKEEILSTNEELTTLNQELIDRNEQLSLSRQYAESIVATIREPLLVLDKDMRVKTANRAFFIKFDISEEQTEGKLLYALAERQWDIPDLRIMLDKVRTENIRMADFDIRYVSESTGERALVLNGCQILREDNAELMILLAIEDVTEAKKREETMRSFSQELEKKVEERTNSLKDANASLKNSNDNLEQFATIASHDLQEPLRKIRTFAAILNKRHSEDIVGEAKELLQKIGISAERMGQLIQDVLSFSKISGTHVFQPTDLNPILKSVIHDFELLISEKAAVIHLGVLPVIEAITPQMNQLFYNILSNALKFSRPDVSPDITISSSELSLKNAMERYGLKRAKAYTEITVADNGIGFDPQFSSQIFLIFQRLNSSDLFDETGIGLALCKKIVTHHQGLILADSGNNNGAIFRIILPLEQEPATS